MSHKGMFVFILRQQKFATLIIISNDDSICKGFLNSQSNFKKTLWRHFILRSDSEVDGIRITVFI